MGDADLFLRYKWRSAFDLEAMLGMKHLTMAVTASGFERVLSMKRLTMTMAALESCDEHADHDQPVGCRTWSTLPRR